MWKGGKAVLFLNVLGIGLCFFSFPLLYTQILEIRKNLNERKLVSWFNFESTGFQP
jgi:hypothetical protein